MKKLFLVALAAVGLASCVQTEELAVANNNQAIGFDTFVDNVTKTLYDNNTLTYFNVYGTISQNDAVVTNIFPGVEVTKGANGWAYNSQYTQYWIPGFTYNFAAVVGAKNDKAVVGLDTNGMPATISTKLEDQEDILYATVERPFGANDTAAKVSFQFAHLLSKAKFTVKNSIAAGSDFVYNVESIKIKNADKEAEYDVALSKWTATNTYEASFGEILSIGQQTQKGNDAEILLVPGTKELAIEVAYNLTYKGTELKAETKNLTAALTLEQGKAYNFIVEFGKPGEDIAFDAEVENWVENDVQTPSVLVTTADELKAALSDPSVAGAILGSDITLGETISRAEAEAGATISKSFVLDGNGKTLTYTGQDRAIDIVSVVENETYKDVTIKDLTIECTAGYCQRGINYNANGTLVLDNVKVGGEGQYITYALNFPGKSDNAKVEINNCEATGCIALNVWGENMEIDVNNSILTSVDKTEVENYSAVVLNNDGTTMANGTVVNITGGKVIALDENDAPSYAVKNNSLTGEVNIDETTEVVGKIGQNVAIVYFDGYNEFYGCLSLADAVEAYFENNASGIRLIRDIELDAPLTIPAGKPVVLDLNGKTLSGVDTTTANFGLVNLEVGADLTVQGGGKLQLSATNNRGWNSYSSVISNQRGTLLVKGGVEIEHLGGTDMAYGIDNLTNGKGTVAVTTIEDATVKSPYRAIRQFLNGVEATNELYVKNGAVIEGTNKSIWMQDPSKNANTGKLVVEAGAQLNGNVYLSVTAGSTEWPVEVSIAKAALVNGSEVLTNNVPEGYTLVESNGNYIVVNAPVISGSTNEECNTALADAIQGGNDTVVLGAGTYVIPDSAQGKTLRLIGSGNPEDTTIAAQNDGAGEGNGDYSFDGATVTFENMTITFTGTYHAGFPRMKGTFKNCIINGQFSLYDSCSFENCTLNVSGDLYNVWTWGAPTATFTKCVFNCDGKAVLLYGTADTTLTMNNCTFNDKGGLPDLKAAIEIGNDYGRSYNLFVNNATVNGFEINDKGINTGTTLWANKNSMGQDKLNVVVDGVDVY